MSKQQREQRLQLRFQHERLYWNLCVQYNDCLLVPLGRGVAAKRSEHVNWTWIFVTVEP